MKLSFLLGLDTDVGRLRHNAIARIGKDDAAEWLQNTPEVYVVKWKLRAGQSVKLF
jgi:hypothetical protein